MLLERVFALKMSSALRMSFALSMLGEVMGCVHIVGQLSAVNARPAIPRVWKMSKVGCEPGPGFDASFEKISVKDGVFLLRYITHA